MPYVPPLEGSDTIINAEPLSLLDLVPLEDLQQLQDMLAEVNGISSVISDPHGNPLTMPSNGLSLCIFSGIAPKGLTNGRHRCPLMGIKSADDPVQLCQPCQSLGLLKAAVPIFASGIHLANWWIGLFSPEQRTHEQITGAAQKYNMDVDMLLNELESYPRGSETKFEKALAWVNYLAKRIIRTGYQKLVMSRDISKLHQVQSELNLYKSNLENLVSDRTVELLNANKELQLQVLERELVEEQIARKSKLLDAINQVLQETLVSRSDAALARACLGAAQELTASPFGFIVGYQDTGWQIMAAGDRALDNDGESHENRPGNFKASGVWQQLIQTAEPMILKDAKDYSASLPLPKGYPEIESLLAVPLFRNTEVFGFVALVNNKEGYSLVDQRDVEALAQAFMEALQRKHAEQDKQKSEKRLNLALDSANEGLWDYFPQSEKIYYSPRWYTMLGYQPDELPDTMETWNTLTHPDDLSLLESSLQGIVTNGDKTFRIDIRMLSGSGQWRWIQVRGRVVDRDAGGKVLRMVGALIDISKYKQVEVALQKANEELQRLAALDELTQIANRRRFDERLALEWRRARRDHNPLAVIICDIDFFKLYNDTYGHLKGDDALHGVAQAINAILKRPMDLVARYGGEEFAMILPNTDIHGAKRVTADVSDAIAALEIEHTASPIGDHITLSFGVAAMVPHNGVSAKVLVAKADKALYKAKAQGRNQIVAISIKKPETPEKGGAGHTKPESS